MIDGTGKKYVENKTIEFYISDDNMPILDNEPMTNELYAAVIDAIKNHPDYKTVCDTAEPANEEAPTIAALNARKEDDDAKWEDEYLRDGNEEDREQFRVGYEDDDSYGDDEYNENSYGLDYEEKPEDSDETNYDELFGFKDSDFEEEERKPMIPTYKSGDTEIELPAANVDNTEIPESVKANKKAKKILKENIKITPVYKKPKSKKRFF